MKTMTILSSLLTFTCSSITGGLTWDVLKTGGQKLVDAFVKTFTDNQCFSNKEQCEEYLETISVNGVNNKKNPYADAENVYVSIMDKAYEGFCSELKQWIEENRKELAALADTTQQNGTITINGQINSGAGKIINAGIYNNY